MILDERRLTAVGRAARAADVGEDGLHRLTRLATEVLDVDLGFVSLVHGEHELLLAGAGAAGRRVPVTLPVSESVCRHLVESGLPLLVEDLHVHPLLGDLVDVRALGLRAYAGTPMRTADGQVLGGLCVGSLAPRAWTAAEAALLAGLADAAATELDLLVALDDVTRVREDEQRRAQEQAALYRVASAVARGAAPAAVLQQVVEELTGLPGVTGALVLRVEPTGGHELVAEAGRSAPLPPTLAGRDAALAGVRTVGRSRTDGESEVPCVVVPVRLHDHAWGALVALVDDSEQHRALAHLEQVADLVRLALVTTEARTRLTLLARTDPLTGVANRRAFDDRFAEELERAARHRTPLVLALLDVDRFKQVNDRFGHDTGDRVLRELAARVGRHLRTGDLLARLGGDEWAVLLPQTDLTAGHAVVERVRADVAAVPLAGVDVTVTIGAAPLADGRAVSAAELYRAADDALYVAKAAGGDRVLVR